MDEFGHIKTLINETPDTVSFGDAVKHANAWNERVEDVASGIEEDIKRQFFRNPDTSLRKKARKERARELTKINMAKKKESNR